MKHSNSKTRISTFMAGLAFALSTYAAHPAHAGDVLILVPVDTEPTEEQITQVATEVAGVNALDSQAMSMSESHTAIEGANHPAHEQLEWTLLHNEPTNTHTMPSHDSLANFGSQPLPMVPQFATGGMMFQIDNPKACEVAKPKDVSHLTKGVVADLDRNMFVNSKPISKLAIFAQDFVNDAFEEKKVKTSFKAFTVLGKQVAFNEEYRDGGGILREKGSQKSVSFFQALVFPAVGDCIVVSVEIRTLTFFLKNGEAVNLDPIKEEADFADEGNGWFWADLKKPVGKFKSAIVFVDAPLVNANVENETWGSRHKIEHGVLIYDPVTERYVLKNSAFFQTLTLTAKGKFNIKPN